MTTSPELKPLGESLGTEALGIDLARPLDAETFGWVSRKFAEHPVLVFRDQNLGALELAAFGRLFGSPRKHALVKYRHAECPEVSWLTNVEDDGKVDWYGVKRATPTQHTKRIRRYSLSCTPRKFHPQKAAPCSPICVPPMMRYRKP